MEEDEKIENYFLLIDEVVNTIKGLGEKIQDSGIVDKVLRTLPKIFDPMPRKKERTLTPSPWMR